MTYLKRSNINGKRTKTRTISIIGLLVVMFLIHFFFPKAYGAILYPITSIFWKSESSTISWFANMGNIVVSKYSLIKENERLSDEIESRDSSMLLIDSLKNENEELKKTLARSGKGDDVLGVILSRPPVSPYDTLIVDIGRSDGIAVGDKVYTSGDTLIGDVVEVYEGQSKVSLFSTPGREMPILVGSSTISVQAVGKGGGNFKAELPADVKIKEGDVIITSQIRPHTFGIVEKILIDSSDSLKTVLFKVPINIHEFRFVQIDKGSGN